MIPGALEARPIDLRLIEEHLAEADRHIAEAELRLTRLPQLKCDGPTTAAMIRQMIVSFEHVLVTMYAHQRFVMAERVAAFTER
jgi:hypothetical protein